MEDVGLISSCGSRSCTHIPENSTAHKSVLVFLLSWLFVDGAEESASCVLSDQRDWLELKPSTPLEDSSHSASCWPLSVFPSALPVPHVCGLGCSRRRAVPRGEDVARSRTGRAACSSTSHTPLQHGQRSNEGFLSSQREVQAAANFIDLICLAFISRTPSNKLLVTFYPKVWGFLASFFYGKLKILILGEQNTICILLIYFNYFADLQQTYDLVNYPSPPCCPHLTYFHFIQMCQ